jgi:dCMP deaminase
MKRDRDVAVTQFQTNKDIPMDSLNKQNIFDEFGLDMAVKAMSSSHDINRQVGCAIITGNGQELIVASNRIPEGIITDYEHRYEQDEKMFWIEHAELSAIFQAAERGISLRGGCLYCTYYPCAGCARGIVSSKIARVVTAAPDFTHHRWGESFKRSKKIMEEAGVLVVVKNFGIKMESPLTTKRMCL